ncbi:MAG: TerC/Alx family metal homeostasis membrane protein [Alphaproteobacteria bacterium]|nr:TerC/Alx family metal homeostasis membrane protein [Alphaproteobacteria bacterium]
MEITSVESLLPWIGIFILILLFLILDLGVFNKVPHKISMHEALGMSAAWVALALCFNLGIWFWKGGEPALAFFTGYLLEKLLSLDNMFVFLIIFNFFNIIPRHQHRILFWGILGAIVFRLFLILLGIKLIQTFDWILYFFGILLLYSSYKIFRERHKPAEIETNAIIIWAKKWIPLRDNYKGRRFFLFREGRWVATPALLVLFTIEVSDIVFAIDSIPAIFAITLDPFIVFTSNIFAILGLRSLYFLIAHILPRFYYLQHALAAILGFIGIKLLLTHSFKIPLWGSLSFIGITLFIAIIASIRRVKGNPH